MRRDANTSSFGVVTKAVVTADDFVPLNPAGTQRRPAMQTEIARDGHATIDAKNDEPLIQQFRGKRLVLDFMRERDGIPEWRQGPPILFGESAISWQIHFKLAPARFLARSGCSSKALTITAGSWGGVAGVMGQV